MTKRWAGVARLGGIGDNLIAASVLRPLKKMGYNVEVITSRPAHVVYFNNPFVDKLTVKTEPNIPIQWWADKATEYDHFVHLAHSCEARHALFVGSFPFWWPQDYRRKLCAGSYLETAHDVAGVAHDFGPLFFPTDEEKEQAARTKAKIGPYVAWILSGTRIDKVWPRATMAIPRVIKELGATVVLFGHGPRDMEHAKVVEKELLRTNSSVDRLQRAFDDNDDNPRWTLRRSLAQMLQADLVVTPDTGPAWAAAMEPMPKVTLVSHASAENITKHWVNATTLHADPERVPCWPCHRLHDGPETCVQAKDENAAACMADISVEAVIGAVAEGLRR